MKFDCPYCGKNYETENGNLETDDLVFTCSNCGKFVGLFHKTEIARKIDKWIKAIKAVKYFVAVLIAISIVLACVFNGNLIWLLVGLFVLVLWDIVSNCIIYRFSALSFQTQKQFESVELQKYLIGQIKK